MYIESIVLFSTWSTFAILAHQATSLLTIAEKQNGKVKTLPKSFFGRIIVTPLHSVIQFATPVGYTVGVARNGFEQPEWMETWSFGVDEFGGKVVIRMLAALALVGTTGLTRVALKHLGAEWHPIGIREKRKHIVRTGPYAYVRHPLYTILLIQQICFAGMFWSYMPLVGLAILFGVFVGKIGIEEKLIEDDPLCGSEYLEYKKSVPARLIPYVW